MGSPVEETVITKGFHHTHMSENTKELEPELKKLLDMVTERGEKGIQLDELLDNLQKNGRDYRVVLAVMNDLFQLQDLGYIHRKIIERKIEGGIEGEIRWFAAGKGESIKELEYGGLSLIPFAVRRMREDE